MFRTSVPLCHLQSRAQFSGIERRHMFLVQAFESLKQATESFAEEVEAILAALFNPRTKVRSLPRSPSFQSLTEVPVCRCAVKCALDFFLRARFAGFAALAECFTYDLKLGMLMLHRGFDIAVPVLRP